MKRSAKYCVYGFLITTVLAVLLLAAAACLPQGQIVRHISQSMDELYAEGTYSLNGDRLPNSLLDMNTDLLILTESLTTNSSDLSTIFTNRMFSVEGRTDADYITVLDQLVNGETPDNEVFYVRYWMGFRVIMRLLLTIMDYYEIRRLTAFVFFMLLACVCYSISVNLNPRIALAFAISIILVKPHIVAVCLQYACCFIIGLSAMLLMPRLYRSQLPMPFVFMELGLLTMYFDFYTTPLVAFGLPMVYLYLLNARDGKQLSAKTIFGYAAVWFAAYVVMWITKLALTSLFTSENGLGDGFLALIGWFTTRHTISGDEFGFFTAMSGIARGFYQYTKWLLFFCAALFVYAVSYLRDIRSGKVLSAKLKDNLAVLVPALLALLWFAAAHKPTYYHSWFQYRTIVVIFWSCGAWLSSARRFSETAHFGDDI